MLKLGFSGRLLAKVTPVASGLSSSNSAGECGSRLHAVNPHTAATIHLRTCYFAGVRRMACPRPAVAVSVTNRAANVIPRNQLGTYIFISSPFCEGSYHNATSPNAHVTGKTKKTMAGMANAAILFKVHLALRHCHMASLTPRVILSCAIFVGLTSGCASSNVL